MTRYVVHTTIPVQVCIDVDDDTVGYVAAVYAVDNEVPGTLADVLANGGRVTDENGLKVKSDYSDGTTESDWDAIRAAYDGDNGGQDWPAWDFGW